MEHSEDKRTQRKRTEEADKPGSGREDELDRALADTFPASDPPAPVTKGTTANPRPSEKK